MGVVFFGRIRFHSILFTLWRKRVEKHLNSGVTPWHFLVPILLSVGGAIRPKKSGLTLFWDTRGTCFLALSNFYSPASSKASHFNRKPWMLKCVIAYKSHFIGKRFSGMYWNEHLMVQNMINAKMIDRRVSSVRWKT